MNILFTYIKAIHRQESTVSVIKSSSTKNRYFDDGIEVCEEETTYHFDNGVVIRYKTERDNAPDELVCEECWISYEVLNSNTCKIAPLRKIFNNSCQEAFWLKIQSQQALI